ncbi:hypothetical protein P700755_002830 [Psychroflexus torquis ATCC 700755]|uniref:GLPGLI family protein n=1 Tax=Psychroflexus torquis (strain ATCC 700755 / CIP 106069 / ACAM 623) TaxID=313595 RepID=K4IKC7_PSYTT|nr:DUF6563 family protein [Psychroflexus torquis]AFU69546.1 hypothetical protein P700755_002830 [Psychroflexus torquis ATCC 700755]
MKKITILTLSLILTIQLFGQDSQNVFKSFTEFTEMEPSQKFDFQFKQRTSGNIFMSGGIKNYRIEKVKPSTSLDYLTKEAWGVFEKDSIFINSYPYSKLIGYNKISGIGYYSYFIGEPAKLKEEQLKLGIINEGESQKGVCCKTSFVILPNGMVKWLTPSYLKELISDNAELVDELESQKLTPDNVYDMFTILDKYNKTKEK